jgi:ribokinase
VVNEAEGVWLGTALGDTDGGALSLHEMLGIIVIRTLGGEGVEWADGGQRYRRPAPPTQVRDTTGAGDCFVGVLAAALDRGATLAEAVTRAVTAASLSCTRVGSQSSLPDARETDAALLRLAAH